MEHLTQRFGRAFERKLELAQAEAGSNSYLRTHLARLSITAIYADQFFNNCSQILEIGFSNILHKIYSNPFQRWDYTAFRASAEFPNAISRITTISLGSTALSEASEIIVNLEDEQIPSSSSTYDAVLCTEVIEHMSCDPMFAMSEINRVLKIGGKLLLTTPNSTSARIFHKLASGYMPSFFMTYSKDRNPYKHNFEYCPHTIKSLVECAGFTIDKLDAIDTFNEPVPSAIDMLRMIQMPTDLRGDNLFVFATKTNEGILNRYPPMIYS